MIESQCASILGAYKPMGNGYKEIIPHLPDSVYADPRKAFIQSMGKDRMTRIVDVVVSAAQTLYTNINFHADAHIKT